MSAASGNSSPSATPQRTGGPLNRILSLLASLQFALAVVVLIALACILGTLVPQGADQVAGYLARHPNAHRPMYVLTSLGLTRVFDAWWFAALLFILAASLLVCTARRYAAIRRTTGAMRARVMGSFITHVSLLLILAGGGVRVVWGQRGVLALHEGETANRTSGGGSSILLPFSVRLAKFELEFYENAKQPPAVRSDTLEVQWPEKNMQIEFPAAIGMEHPVMAPDAPAGADPEYTVSILRYEPDFSINGRGGEVISRSSQPNNPALLVSVVGSGSTNAQWVFARFPDFTSHGGRADAGSPPPLKFRFHAATSPAAADRAPAQIKAFRSTLEVLENDRVVRNGTAAVNAPFSYGGYTFYQSSYNPDNLTWSALQVVRDPGVPIVYAGFALMMVGLTVVFCVGPWLDAQRRTKGDIR